MDNVKRALVVLHRGVNYSFVAEAHAVIYHPAVSDKQLSHQAFLLGSRLKRGRVVLVQTEHRSAVHMVLAQRINAGYAYAVVVVRADRAGNVGAVADSAVSAVVRTFGTAVFVLALALEIVVRGIHIKPVEAQILVLREERRVQHADVDRVCGHAVEALPRGRAPDRLKTPVFAVGLVLVVPLVFPALIVGSERVQAGAGHHVQRRVLNQLAFAQLIDYFVKLLLGFFLAENELIVADHLYVTLYLGAVLCGKTPDVAVRRAVGGGQKYFVICKGKSGVVAPDNVFAGRFVIPDLTRMFFVKSRL